MAKRGPKTTGAGATHTEQLYNSRTDATLSESAKIYRDAFVREYIKDFSGKGAAIRIGVPATSAHVRASHLLREPYVANKLDEMLRQLRPEDVVTRGQVMAKMWQEANDPNNEGGTRVAATAHVAKMLGMDRQKDETNQQPVGVILIPCTSPDDWSQAAATAQQVLKQRASEGV